MTCADCLRHDPCYAGTRNLRGKLRRELEDDRIDRGSWLLRVHSWTSHPAPCPVRTYKAIYEDAPKLAAFSSARDGAPSKDYEAGSGRSALTAVLIIATIS